MIKCKKCRYGVGTGRRDRPGSQQTGGAAMKFIKSRRKVEPKAGWISVEDALPRESGYYLVATRYGDVHLLPYSIVHHLFNTRDEHTVEQAREYAFDTVRYWMYAPDPPEELR